MEKINIDGLSEERKAELQRAAEERARTIRNLGEEVRGEKYDAPDIILHSGQHVELKNTMHIGEVDTSPEAVARAMQAALEEEQKKSASQ